MFKRPILFILIPLCLIIILVEAYSSVFFIRNHYSKHVDKDMYYKVLIKSQPIESKKTLKHQGEITYYLSGNKWHSTTGDIMIYFSKKDSAQVLKYGDVITTNSPLLEIENREGSPFDYKRFMQRRRIYDNVFLRKDSWKKIEENKGNWLIASSRKVKLNLENKLLNSNLGRRESALAIGMLLGDKAYFDQEVIRQFTSAGLTHILCVSGMNVALIIIVIDFLLKLLSMGNYRLIIWRKIIAVIISFAICFIVGLNPSVLRVAIMMSVILLTKYIGRGYDSINSLLVTAFIFLCFDPLILFNWSFQFSFLAVFGIVMLGKYLAQIKSKLHWSLKPFASAAGMTISAQLFVMPLIISRFRYFPTYTLLANIIIVPFLSIVLVNIILFLIIGDVPLIGTFTETVLNYELLAMQNIISWIDSLPYSNIKF